jgi:molecular chaperone GrpE
VPDHDSKRNRDAEQASGPGDVKPGAAEAGDVDAGAPEADEVKTGDGKTGDGKTGTGKTGTPKARTPKADEVEADEVEADASAAGDGQAPADRAQDDAAPAAGAGEPEQADKVIDVEGELLEEGEDPAAGKALADQVERDSDLRDSDLEVELLIARAEAERNLDDLRRLKADFENYRKRMLREQTQMAASASQALVARLLPVLDHFELAVGSAEQSRDFEKMLKGVKMVFGELRETMRHEGLEQIEAEGKPFDPQRHEAVVTVQDSAAEPGTVVGVVRAGYELHGRVIRPAMVRVAQ